MNEFPISCVRCRRRKIKCNKHYPCNQCSCKGFRCEFPAKFRSRSINETAASRAVTDSNTRLNHSASSVDVQKLVNEIERLKMENVRLEQENQRSSNEDLSSPSNSASDRLDSNEQAKLFPISGETSELGQKYYGPFSSKTMEESLLLMGNEDPFCEKHHKHTWTSNPSEMSIDSDMLTPNRPRGNYDCPKKPLPWVLEADDSDERNMRVIKRLVAFFFELPKYHYFLSESCVMQFVDSHSYTLDDDWDGDDDLLLLHMILVLLVRRLSPARYNLCGITDHPVRSTADMYRRIDRLVTKRLVWGFLKLRHNLVSETYLTVQSYILCSEFQFTEQRYEESWSMLFHCCAVAYAIGLHVTMNIDAPSSSLFSKVSGNNIELFDQYASMSGETSVPANSDNAYHIAKVKTWYALRNITGHICSILGRPNPILIQLNLKVLMSLNCPEETTNNQVNNANMIQLKSGLSECIRLLNLMLIESYIMNVSEQEVLNLDIKFKEEDKSLKYFISSEYQDLTDSLSKQEHPVSKLPMVVDREETLCDLIILHVNRIKLLERFLSLLNGALHFSIGLLSDSIICFLDYTYEFVQSYVNSEVPQFLDGNGKLITEDYIDKIFLIKFSFVSAFIYQGIIVLFILLNSKGNEFIGIDSIDLLTKIDYKISLLLEITCSICDSGNTSLNFWSPNMFYLMNQILDRKEKIVKQCNEHRIGGQVNANFSDSNLNPSLYEIFRMTGEDPFWATNSDTAPFLLGYNTFDYGLLNDQNEQDDTRSQKGDFC